MNRIIKIDYYKPIKTMIDTTGLTKVIINMIVKHHDFPVSIISDWDSLFTSKLRFLLYYFFNIRQKLFTGFYPQTDIQTKKPNSTIKAYLCAFVN